MGKQSSELHVVCKLKFLATPPRNQLISIPRPNRTANLQDEDPHNTQASNSTTMEACTASRTKAPTPMSPKPTTTRGWKSNWQSSTTSTVVGPDLFRLQAEEQSNRQRQPITMANKMHSKTSLECEGYDSVVTGQSLKGTGFVRALSVGGEKRWLHEYLGSPKKGLRVPSLGTECYCFSSNHIIDMWI